jgi:hypothetical protein
VKTRLSLDEYVGQLPAWYRKYSLSEFFEEYARLEANLSQEASTLGYLDKGELMGIAIWGGDEDRHELGSLIVANNSDDVVREHTMRAICRLDSPEDALRSLLAIDYVGPAYGTKTLRCVDPERHAAFDVHVRRACAELLPTMEDREGEICGYVMFLHVCKTLRERLTAKGPRPDGSWYMADIEMAIFQFAREVSGVFRV